MTVTIGDATVLDADDIERAPGMFFLLADPVHEGAGESVASIRAVGAKDLDEDDDPYDDEDEDDDDDEEEDDLFPDDDDDDEQEADKEDDDV